MGLVWPSKTAKFWPTTLQRNWSATFGSRTSLLCWNISEPFHPLTTGKPLVDVDSLLIPDRAGVKLTALQWLAYRQSDPKNTGIHQQSAIGGGRQGVQVHCSCDRGEGIQEDWARGCRVITTGDPRPYGSPLQP
ncbi:hypothetical protein LshimejAT787_1102500 [Lyophyllum shimeji]|uniref:Uncharacterized protein n=1 Tax=Lyophyllum shimeji TaxID=47721 RepID=A0A9P3USA5_LYOSH|nr:hypothetical protein LshimejAT787_1102500 [Lyophyllum shimeji]